MVALKFTAPKAAGLWVVTTEAKMPLVALFVIQTGLPFATVKWSKWKEPQRINREVYNKRMDSDRESRDIFCDSEVFRKTRFCQYIVGFPGRSCATLGSKK